jgi:hypothetical protein
MTINFEPILLRLLISAEKDLCMLPLHVNFFQYALAVLRAIFVDFGRLLLYAG